MTLLTARLPASQGRGQLNRRSPMTRCLLGCVHKTNAGRLRPYRPILMFQPSVLTGKPTVCVSANPLVTRPGCVSSDGTWCSSPDAMRCAPRSTNCVPYIPSLRAPSQYRKHIRQISSLKYLCYSNVLSYLSSYPTITTTIGGKAASGIGNVCKGLECWGILTGSTKSTRVI